MIKYNWAEDKSQTFNKPCEAQTKVPGGVLPSYYNKIINTIQSLTWCYQVVRRFSHGIV